MPNELALDKRRVRLNVPLELARKVEKAFRLSSDNFEMVSYIRALEEACKNVVLTRKDYACIGVQVEQNRVKRMNARELTRKANEQNKKKG